MVKRLQTKLLLLLGLLFVGTGMTWAKVYTSTLTFTAACGGTGTADDGAVWTVTSDAEEFDFDQTKGIHYGANGKAVGYIQLSTSFTVGKITKIVVEASGNNTPTLSITVGGEAFGNNQTVTTTNTAYTFTDVAEAGDVVVRLAKESPAKRALYIKSVVITYETGYDPQLAYSEESVIINQDDQFNAPVLTFADNFEGAIAYTSSDENVATIDDNGDVTIEGAGTTTITASFVASEDDDWISSVASYTLRVMSPDAPVGISFGNGNVKIDGPSVTGEDSYGNTWTITTDCGEYTYFGQQNGYSQVGSKNNYASSIIFTTTLPDAYTVLEISAMFGGSQGTSAVVTLEVDGTPVGDGSLSNRDVVTVTSKSQAIGKTLTVKVTEIVGGVNCYNISYKVIAPVEITMNQYGMMSYAYDKALDFSAVEGLTAYYASDYNATDMSLTMTSMNVTAAGAGMMLKGEANKTYAVPVATSISDITTQNYLVGLTEPTNVPKMDENGYTTFILSRINNAIKWYMLKEEKYTLKANSAYLRLPADAIPQGQQPVVMDFTGGSNSISTATTTMNSNDLWYTLDGRLLQGKPVSKGIYVNNGRKIVIK